MLGSYIVFTKVQHCNYLQLNRFDSLFSEDSQYKVSLFVRFEAGRNDQIIARREFEPPRHFSQVAEKYEIFLKKHFYHHITLSFIITY